MLPSGFVGCIDVVRLKKGRDVNVLEVWSGDELFDAGVLLLEGPVTILLPGEDIAVGCWINVSCPSVVKNKKSEKFIDLLHVVAIKLLWTKDIEFVRWLPGPCCKITLTLPPPARSTTPEAENRTHLNFWFLCGIFSYSSRIQ